MASEGIERIQEQVGGEVVDGTVGYFVRERAYNEVMSTEAGQPVFVLHDFCMVRVPGRSTAEKQLVRKTLPDGTEVSVSDYHQRRFPKAWDAFLRGEDLRPDGTLLEDCPAIPKERLPELKAAAVRTVEELAGLPDASVRRVGHDGYVLRQVAQEYLAENNEIAQLRARVAELESASTKRRGRPKKVTDDDHSADADGGREYDRAASAN